MIISKRRGSTCGLKCNNCGKEWRGNYYVQKRKTYHYCPSCSYKKGWENKHEKIKCNVPLHLKPYILKRDDCKSIDSWMPKNKELKLLVKCSRCGKEYHSNAYDIFRKERVLCSSCVQIGKCENGDYDYSYRKTSEYREMMSKAVSSSEKYKKARPIINKATKKYWERIRGRKFSEIKDKWYQYRRIVYKLSEQTYKRYKETINPDRLQRGRGKYHLDHKFTVMEGFKNNIPPYVMSHWSNLQMLKERENIIKDYRSDITMDELFEGVFTVVAEGII